MSTTLAILTIGVLPFREILPLLTEHIPEEQITHKTLLGNLPRKEVMAHYAIEPGEDDVLTLLSDSTLASLSRQKVARALQAAIEVLDNQSFDVILLMSTAEISGLAARNAILLEPRRIIPPLVASIVDGHQVGVIVPVVEQLAAQRRKWQMLENPPLYAIASPLHNSDSILIAAGRQLLAQGADVLMLDCLGFHQHHRDVLQKALAVPVLLSNVMLVRLASELLV